MMGSNRVWWRCLIIAFINRNVITNRFLQLIASDCLTNPLCVPLRDTHQRLPHTLNRCNPGAIAKRLFQHPLRRSSSGAQGVSYVRVVLEELAWVVFCGGSLRVEGENLLP